MMIRTSLASLMVAGVTQMTPASAQTTPLYDPLPGTPGFEYMSAASKIAVPCTQHLVQNWGYLYTLHHRGYDGIEAWRHSFAGAVRTIYDAATAVCGRPYVTTLAMLGQPDPNAQATELTKKQVDLDLMLLKSGVLLDQP
jgi:hypothetical protein